MIFVQQTISLCYNLGMKNIDLAEITDMVARKEFKEARDLLLKMAADDEKHIEELKLLGLCNVNLENYREGQSNYETVVKYKPDDATSWFYLASCYDCQNDLLHAKAAYHEVIKLRENYLEAYKCLCVVYVKSNEEDKAIELAQKALEFEKEDYTLYYIIGTAYMAKKKFKESLEYLEKALELNPEHSQLYNNLGTSYITIGNLDKAYENFIKASELDPKNSITYFNIASILQMKNEHKEACEYFKKAYVLEPNDSYLTALALSEVKLEDWENAIQHYKILATHHPEKQNYQYNLACCYEMTGEINYAIGILARLVTLNPKSVSMGQKLASLFLKIGHTQQAKEIYEKILVQGNVSFEVYYEFAHICTLTQDMDKAEKILKKVVELKPDFAAAHKDLGIIYLSKRLFDYAKDEFEQAVAISPDDSKFLYEYANYLHATTDFAKADEYYEKALEKDSENSEILAFSALNKIHTNDLEKALEQINKAVEKSVQSGFLLYIAGKIRFVMKDFEEAKRFLIKSYELEKNNDVKNLLALCYFELGDFKQANNIFSNLLKENPMNVNLLLNSAKCYKELKEIDSALKTLEKAVEIFPECEEAHELIRELS